MSSMSLVIGTCSRNLHYKLWQETIILITALIRAAKNKLFGYNRACEESGIIRTSMHVS